MKRLIALLLLSLPVVQVHADDRLGRLFLTPNERANLDYLRLSSAPPDKLIRPADNDGAEVGAPAPVVPMTAVTVQGYVKRSDGKGTVWVNRQPVLEAGKQGEIGVGRLSGKDGRVRLKVDGSGKEVSLKAGQTYDPASGVIVDHARDLPQTANPVEAPAVVKASPSATAAKPAAKP